MPGGDRTGPRGLGPRTGRAAGYCAGYAVPGYMNPDVPGYGRGFGFGRGRGFGRGFRGRGRGQDTIVQDSQEEHLEVGEALAEAGVEVLDVDSGDAVEVFGVEDITQNHITNQHHTTLHTSNKYHLSRQEKKKKPI